MQVILLEDMPKLGNIGDLVTVKDGYARNYLLPRNKALVASVRNVKSLSMKNVLQTSLSRRLAVALKNWRLSLALWTSNSLVKWEIRVNYSVP